MKRNAISAFEAGPDAATATNSRCGGYGVNKPMVR
jgi:hypothetical protein